MTTPLLTTKLYMPPIRPELVPRPRLIEHLNEGLHRRLILVSAPAGFGKTTLISVWIKNSGIVAAWISLDEGDNDPARFLAYLVAALRTIEESIGKGTLAALQSPQPPDSEILLTALINEINALPHRLILALDDYHLITARPVHEAVSFLIDHLPPQMQVVMATRADPPLPIARLRGRGQLTELRQTDLRFSLDEATAFLKQVMALDLSTDDIDALTARTEGWITGLQRAALALQAAVPAERQDPSQIATFVQAFTGSNRYILDYLVEEVLQRQPEDIQTFLLQTAILDRLTGPLCDAVLEIGDWRLDANLDTAQSPISRIQYPISRPPSPSQQILERLEAANLFIVPLDNERRWYRYHRLFADLLRKRLQHVQPEQEPILHRRASAWFEQKGLIAEAIDHALFAQDHERAAGLIEQVAEATLMRSELITFLGWVDALPDELVQARPSLGLFHAWALLWSGQPLASIESRLQDLETDTESASIKVATLRSFLATWQGRISRASAMAQEALEQLPEDEFFLRSIAAWNVGISLLLSGEIEAGSQAFDEVTRMGQKAGNVLMAVSALCHLAELRMSQAEYREAEGIYRRALQSAMDAQGRPLPIGGMALIGLGEISREWNDLEAATRYLTEGIECSGRWGDFGALDGHLAMARTRQAGGDAKGARDSIQNAQRIAIRFDVTDLDDLVVAIHQVRLWLAQGDTEAAVRWLGERGHSLPGAPQPEPAIRSPGLAKADDSISRQMRSYEHLLLARTLLALDRPADALPLLEQHIAMLEQQDRRKSRRMIEVQSLKALALQAQGDVNQALRSLERALSIAEPGGFVRIFVDEGEPMLQLLRQAATRGIAPGYVRRLIAAYDLPAQAGMNGAPGDTHKPAQIIQPLVEPLSKREMDVLRLLATGMTNPEIAQELYVATSTVRSHLKNIYSKLNVHKRWDAVHRAEELGLL
jgi:LuxR family maltose regulon positive regulatory protein